MNRHQRRADAARDRKPADRAEVIRSVYNYLANIAAPTATGATLFLPDGSSLYLSADDARAMCGNAKSGAAQ